MQLLPFVKRLRIIQASGPLGPRRLLKMFNTKALAHFSALSNVRELGIDDLDLDTFTPQALLCLNHFASSLRSLALRTPRGSHQQLLHFLGLFPNIDDLKLIYYYVSESSPSDPALVPQSAPSLRGRLRLISFDGEVFLRALSELSGGLRFRYVELLYAKGARFLLNTCANTLEALRIYTGARIRSLGPPATLLQDFDLSNSRSLRSLEITITSLYRNDALSFLRDLLSTITSLVFSEVVIVLEDGDILNVDFFQYTLFGVVRDMYAAKPFRLVFCLEVRDGDLEATVERLKWHIGLEETRGGLGFLSCPPVIITDTLATHGPSARRFVDFSGYFEEMPHAL